MTTSQFAPRNKKEIPTDMTICTASETSPSHFQLVDMKYITSLTGMTDKWFYALIKRGTFPKPIKLGRSSRWCLTDIEKWINAQCLNS